MKSKDKAPPVPKEEIAFPPIFSLQGDKEQKIYLR